MRLNKFCFLGLFVAVLCLFSCTNKKIFEERKFISLAGMWQCDLGEIYFPGSVDESRLAPHTVDTLRTSALARLHPYVGKMNYTREVEIPASSAGKEWRLVMERTKPSVVWIDGDSIGASKLLLSPQVYSIGKLSAGKHTICIEIDNSRQSVPRGIQGSHAWTDATQTNWNGIIGRFGLEANEGVVIESLQLYPSVSSDVVPVIAKIYSATARKGKIKVRGYSWNTSKEAKIAEQTIDLDLQTGTASYSFDFQVGKERALWSEFDPALYKVNFELSCDSSKDFQTVDFGIRDFSTQGTQFSINSLTTFLRGKHDGCVFPLTGYPPMEKEEWIRQFRISKQFGINHYRFHSWTPPQAAFDAANEEGIYMQAELPFWGTMSTENTELNEFLIREGEYILTTYGNNPSFVMMALGNELGGDTEYMRSIVNDFRKSDNRRLYAFGSNNGLGTGGQQEGEDFFVTCRVGGLVGSDDYSMHTRTTFSFADAKEGGYMNGLYPSTDRTFEKAVEACTVPIISHENGQFQIYPNYDEIKKYTGVLYPYNMEVFRRRLQENGLGDQAEAFHKVTTRFAALCYKEDIEMCLRTPGFGGFQLLDLQDYPGQGSAYVGLLDAFMDPKAGITADEFAGFCSEIVPMAIMSTYCWSQSTPFTAEIKVSNFSANALAKKKLTWNLSKAANDESISEGTLPIDIPQGELGHVGSIDVPLNNITVPTQLRLTLTLDNHVNKYDLWVYPETEQVAQNSIKETSSLQEAKNLLAKGEKVLYVPNHQDIESISVGGLFTPDYWNYAMFKRISENVHRDVSPGTLSILTNPSHSLFTDFPTDSCTNWQWWTITKNSRPLILDHTPVDYKPLVQVVDNIERNHKLGLLFEMQVGEGKLFVSMCDFAAVADKPEGRQFHRAILRYMNSSQFAPTSRFTPDELTNLFHTSIAKRAIEGVRNITEYK